MTRSISECATTKYHSDIGLAVVLGQTETIGEDGTRIRMVGKARPGREVSDTDAGRPEPQYLCGTFIKSSVVTGRCHNTRPCIFSVF